MSSTFGDAQLLVRPNTAGFATQLREEVTAAIAGVQRTLPPLVVTAGVVTDVAGVSTEAAAGNKILTESSIEASSALREQGVSTSIATGETNLLARAEDLAGAALERFNAIATASELVTGVVAKRKAELAAADTALAAAEDAAAAALETQNTALIASTSALLKNAEAAQAAAFAAAKEAVATSGSAAAHEQLARGVGTAGLSFVGLRAQVLAASGPFVIGAAAALLAKKAIGETSDTTEQLNKAIVVFGNSADIIEKWSKTTAQAFGISEREALGAAATFGGLFRTLGTGTKPSAEMSKRLVELAADMASFNNVSPERALEALRAGLVGQSRPLRTLQVFLTAATVQEEALAETGKKTADALTQQDLVLARYNLILKQTVIQQGDFARTSEHLANQSRKLKAEISDLGAQLGSVLVPAALFAVEGLNALFGAISTDIRTVGELGGEIKKLAADVASSSPVEFVVNIVRKVDGKSGGGSGGKSLGDQFKTDLELGIGGALIAVGTGLDAFGVGLAVQAGGAAVFIKGLNDMKGKADSLADSLITMRATMHSLGLVTATTQRPLEDAAHAVGDLFDQLRQHPDTTSFDAVRTRLAALISVLRTGPPQAQAMADALQKILLKINLDPNQIPGGDKVADALLKAIADAMDPGILTDALVDAGTKAVGDAAVAVANALGSPTQQLGVLRPRAAQQKATLARLLGLDPNASTEEILAAASPAELQRKVRIGQLLQKRANRIADIASQLESTNSQIESITGKFASDARAAAQRIKTARQKADQAVLDAISAAQGQADLRKTIAAGTKNTLDDLNALLHERAVIRQLITNLVPRIHDEQQRAQILAQLRAAEAQTTNEIKKLRDDRKNARIAARQAANEARQTHLEALLSIAQTTVGTADDVRALKRIIAFDNARIAELTKLHHRTREENALLDAYRVDLAQRNQALREIKGEAEKGNVFAQAAFKFLQTQQGFAANLIGNLIPGGLTGGLVSSVANGTTAATAALSPPRQVPGGFEQPRGATAEATRGEASRTRPPSSGQANTQIVLLRDIRNLLRKLSRGSDHPEAKHQRTVAAAMGDYGSPGPGV